MEKEIEKLRMKFRPKLLFYNKFAFSKLGREMYQMGKLKKTIALLAFKYTDPWFYKSGIPYTESRQAYLENCDAFCELSQTSRDEIHLMMWIDASNRDDLIKHLIHEKKFLPRITVVINCEFWKTKNFHMILDRLSCDGTYQFSIINCIRLCNESGNDIYSISKLFSKNDRYNLDVLYSMMVGYYESGKIEYAKNVAKFIEQVKKERKRTYKELLGEIST